MCFDISDVNECETDICSHGCVDTIDSYFCTCNPGYTLMSDRHHCRGTLWQTAVYMSWCLGDHFSTELINRS